MADRSGIHNTNRTIDQDPGHLIEDSTLTEHPITQSQSPLILLPPEIRLKVLRELLVSPLPIPKRQKYPSPQTGNASTETGRTESDSSAREENQGHEVHGCHLRPQILATCQHILQEGWPILYGENTLSVDIVCNGGRSPVLTCPCQTEPLYEISLNKTKECASVMDESFFSGVPGITDWTTNDDLIAVTAGFNKAHMTVEATCNNYDPSLGVLKKTLQVIQTSMHLKDIEVTVVQLLTVCEDFIPCLKIFLALRCDRFKFIGIDNRAAPDVQQVITSSLPVSHQSKMRSRILSLLMMLTYLSKLEGTAEASEREQKQFEVYQNAIMEAENNFVPRDFLEARPRLTMMVKDVVELTAGIMELELRKDDEIVSQVVAWNKLHDRDGLGGSDGTERSGECG